PSPRYHFSHILLPRPPSSTLFPYTTLFRSDEHAHQHDPLEAVAQEHVGPAEQRRAHERHVEVLAVGASEHGEDLEAEHREAPEEDRKSTRLNSSHDQISYAVFCLKKKKKKN